MNGAPTRTGRRTLTAARPTTHSTDQDLVAVSQWLPGTEPCDCDVYLKDGIENATRFWRCRKWGQGRNRREEFTTPREVDRLRNPLTEGGYSVDDPRTRRPLSETMTVHFGDQGPTYRVDSERGNSYCVDVEADTCTRPDYEKREVPTAGEQRSILP